MKRRIFIEKSILAYLGLAISPSLLASCRKETLLPNSDFSGKVIIVGAGAAGLYAGYILKSRGIDFIILATLSPDYVFPGPGVSIQKNLEISESYLYSNE